MSMTIEVVFKNHPEGMTAAAKIVGKGKLNLVDRDVLERASEKLLTLSVKEDLRCLTVEGSTEYAFIGGADLKELRRLTPETAFSFIGSIHRFCSLIRKSNFPVIAKMRGYCLGAGLEIAAACDIRIADQSVKCGMPEVRVGVPSVVEAALLPGLIGWGKAKEIMFRGNIFGSQEAQSIGLLQEVVSSAKLESVCKEMENDILSSGKNAIASQKRLFLDWESGSIDESIKKSMAVFSNSYESNEPQVMIDKFFDKKE